MAVIAIGAPRGDAAFGGLFAATTAVAAGVSGELGQSGVVVDGVGRGDLVEGMSLDQSFDGNFETFAGPGVRQRANGDDVVRDVSR